MSGMGSFSIVYLKKDFVHDGIEFLLLIYYNNIVGKYFE
ncbi:hypothetical protein OXPF_18010 [Oxobacter pfennigii]|uniref:Uncharacterized protein n=1 Tax=Oxobacter pfennigii TaxID=36849 RepID=A0A0P8YC64_9CLOT|nr:hypothetical protein OXPF_18010 [Oxobacter pfennigii]